MSGRSSRHVVIALSLVLLGVTELVAKEKVILVYPGVMKTIPGPKKPSVKRGRRNPRVGTRRTESRLSSVTIEHMLAKSDKKGARKSARKSARSASREEDDERPEAVETVDVEKKQNTIQILAKDDAAGQLFKLTALLTIRTSQYKKISRDQFGKKIQPYTTWVDFPDREQKQEFTLAVALGTLPHVLVPTGKEITISLPEALRRLAFTRKRRTQAELQLEAGNRLRILGKTPGVTEFEFRYQLAGKKLTATLPVRVLKKEIVVSIVVEEDRKEEVGFDEIDELFGLDFGRVLRVDGVEDPSVAEIVFDAYRVQVRGLKAGTTRALLAYTGTVSGRGRRRQRVQTQVPLIITVK